ncbi:hypothetical protein HRR83_006188 [Exophiala dermatitidis]|uniref:Uncharacterized protein n=1 Tax=Exophiala dermatitidis TaxID=5970 RepID=A0AAN6IVH0_EXODE|nr:hypothetical protein HRR74_005584 [Exophiala dermatitidis]KAJ4517612.1 hypothetical protein HRR73_004664 [Exophiala dermatitidis]KAJ4548629.1 hypothetical protein HRR76_001219 [Exophiala dermatitidis]KAJ4552650.1 hypothetical protein HRR77_002651 [Exophiala dermatitidis]KAJ4567151.1 hypothetical protein HRR81_007227 [Exophiala dermatitidis]
MDKAAETWRQPTHSSPRRAETLSMKGQESCHYQPMPTCSISLRWSGCLLRPLKREGVSAPLVTIIGRESLRKIHRSDRSISERTSGAPGEQHSRWLASERYPHRAGAAKPKSSCKDRCSHTVAEREEGAREL